MPEHECVDSCPAPEQRIVCAMNALAAQMASMDVQVRDLVLSLEELALLLPKDLDQEEVTMDR